MACLGLLPLIRTAACIAESAEWVLLCCHLGEISLVSLTKKGGEKGMATIRLTLLVRNQDIWSAMRTG